MGTRIGTLQRRGQWAWSARLVALTCAALSLVTGHASAQQRKTEGTPAGSPTEITIGDTSVGSENLTSTSDGTVFFGSTTKGTIYRALPGKAQAEAWIRGADAKLTNVLGVLADEKSNTLWVCDNAPFGRGAPPAGLPALRSFDLKTGDAKDTYPSPNGGVCNDVAIAADGTAYASDTFGGRVLRLKPGARSLDVWLADPQLRGVDGLSLLADGALYVNNIFNGKLLRLPVKEDGTAGQIMEIPTSVPFSRPDGMRASGPKTLLQIEGSGRLAEITIDGDKGKVRILKEGLANATGVTQIGATALVLVERNKAVPVPMTASVARASAEPPTQAGGVGDAEKALLDLSRQKWAWMSEKNVDALEGLFHEKSMFTHMGGTWPRNRELEIIKSGSIHYKKADIEEASVRVIGTTAIVMNRIRLLAVVGGNEVTNPFMVTEVYVREDGKWKLAQLSFSVLRGS
jgi:Domain of unknown function (DUF4440)